MVTCTRKIEFDAAHRIVDHKSVCRNLHGHRYVAEITVASDQLSKMGMVRDFGDIKDIIGGWIDETWDHGIILNSTDSELVAMCLANDWKVCVLDGNPTVENMARRLIDVAQELLGGVVGVKLFETPNCWAEVLKE